MKKPDWRVETFDRLQSVGPKPHYYFYFRILGRNGQVVAQSEAYVTAQARDGTAKKLCEGWWDRPPRPERVQRKAAL